MSPILYLDYDGVLHPADVRVTREEPLRPRIYEGGRPTDCPLFEHAPLLERLLEPFPDVRISLATSWVRALGYKFAVQQLPPALRARVVGTIWQGWLLQVPPLRRHDAVTTDAEERKVPRWLALDDDVEGWPAERRHLVVAPTNSWQGLAQPGVADELSEALGLLCSGKPLESRIPMEPHFPSTVDRLFGSD
ncbi:HAD domain-containing protein [Massilia sp. 9096]|uniref:HAD domain-containing protein n=1 Tax=Massilia sp. 9096 TaxID=1500894 RepID=UPI0018CC8BA5